MAKLNNLKGKTFSNLTVIERCPSSSKDAKWSCLCTCGKIIEVFANNLSRGHTKSCGCLFKSVEMGVCADGLRNHPLYQVWKTMIYRCCKPNRKEYKNYGGRGITVCERWMVFESFIADMYPTYKNGKELDRDDNDGNYEPSNCQWVEEIQNKQKTRRTKLNYEIAAYIHASNETSITLAEMFGCSRDAIYDVKQNKTWI